MAEPCRECNRPLTLIDFYGQRLDECLPSNLWTEIGDANLWRKLPEADVEALRGLRPRLRVIGE